jgi:hypothetical protein
LAAYEALVYVLSALSTPPIYHFLDFVEPKQLNGAIKLPLDLLATTYLGNINSLLTNGVLTRSRRAVLMCWKVSSSVCMAQFCILTSKLFKQLLIISFDLVALCRLPAIHFLLL